MPDIIELPNQRAESVEKSPLKIRQFLVHAVENHAEVRVWIRKSMRDAAPLGLRGRLQGFQPKTAEVTVELPESPDVSAKGPSEKQVIQVLVFLKRGGVVGFVADGCEWNDRKLSVKSPERLFRIHRRKDERYELPRGIEILVRLPNATRPTLSLLRRLHDISGGGLSVELGASEGRLYTKGRFLSKVKLTIQGREIVFSGQIQGKGAILLGRSQKPGVKLGIAFRKLSDDDREFIRTYVLEHMIQYLSRLDY